MPGIPARVAVAFIGMSALSLNAQQVLEARYYLRDSEGRILEDFEGLCQRVASGVAEGERAFGDGSRRESSSGDFFNALVRREFLPNSPTLMNAGCPSAQLSACFVIPVEDSLDGIFEAARRMAVIHKSGGGTGFSFSRVRPQNDSVGNTPGVAAGPLAFLGVFDSATSVIVQGGRRRGANMGVLRIDHPDILAFVRSKSSGDEGALTNFNLSVAVGDDFFRAALAGEAFDLCNPRDGKVLGSVNAAELLEEIARAAWSCGDPGLIFLDAVNRDNPTPEQGDFEATNPCGELPLLPNESCNLGSLRLDAFVTKGAIAWDRLDSAVDLAVRFLDDVIEVSAYPFPEIEARTRANRKIGLGVMGFADLLVDLGIPYDSQQAVRLAEEVMGRIRTRAGRASMALAEERGVFPAFAESLHAARGQRLRNATVTSIAPTGTLAILADCSNGIEPYFALAYVRHALDGQELKVTNQRFEDALRRSGAYSEDLIAEVRATGSVRGMAGVPAELQRLFVTAPDIAPEAHLDVQQAFQAHVDNAVSKTINLPARATPEDVKKIYQSAWERGLKGITVFREGSKASAALVRGDVDSCPVC
jgi:ribonucleoside-diphosphate reductase alpha chain